MSDTPTEKVRELREKLEECRSRVSQINAEYAGEYLDPESDDGVEWNSLNEQIDATEKTLRQCEAREARVRELAENPGNVEPGFNIRPQRVRGDEIYDLSTLRNAASSPEDEAKQLRDRSLEAIERGDYASADVSKEDAQTQAEKLLRTKDKNSVLARRMLETGSETYMRAFGKKMEGKELSDIEARALNTSDSTGGYNIPFTLDPSIIHTSNYSVNPYRAIARVEQIVTDEWHGIATAGASVTRSAEAEEVEENAVEFSQPSAKPTRATFFIPFSMEIGQDWPSLQSEMTRIIGEAKDDEEASSFSTAAGTGVFPQGVFIGGTVSVNTAGTAAFAVGDLYKVFKEVTPRSRSNASWVGRVDFYNAVRQFDTTGGAQLWTDNLRVGAAGQAPSAGNVGFTLLGKSAYECSAAPYATTAGGTIAIVGDFSRFLIVDRIGMNVEIVQHLVGENRRPTLQRGLLAAWRNTSKVLDPNAFRKLKALS